MKRSLSASFSLLLLTTSCVPFASSVDPIYVSSMTYDRWDCSKLEAENTRLSSEVARLEGLQNANATADTAMTTVGILVAWPILFGLAATHDHRVELASAKGQLAAATQARQADQCVTGPRTRELRALAPTPSLDDDAPRAEATSETGAAAVRPMIYSAQTVGRPESAVSELMVARDMYRSCLANVRGRATFATILPRLGDIRTGQVENESSTAQTPTVTESVLLRDYWRSSHECRAAFEASSRRSSSAVADAIQKFDDRNDSTINLLVARKVSWVDAAVQQNDAQRALRSELKAITF